MTAALSRQRLIVLAAVSICALAVAVPLKAAEENAYTVHTLVSSATDADLINAWGLTAGPNTPWWVSDNGTDLSTVYNAAGTKLAPRVPVAGAPTGAVFNATGPGGTPAGFPVDVGTTTAPAFFIFATEGGTIQAWTPGLGLTGAAEVRADRSDVDAVYKGLAIAGTGSAARIYATDFANGRVDVWDSSWSLITVPGGFADPALPPGYAPFGIQAIGNRIFVTFAKQQAGSDDEAHGQGLGFVDAFDADGNLLGRVAQRGQLNAPWGLASAPASFGRFGGDLLVGNFGDGEINAFAELPNGQFEFRGQLRDAAGGIISIDGLWALEFGHGNAASGPADSLFFTAGPEDESQGLFGDITAG